MKFPCGLDCAGASPHAAQGIPEFGPGRDVRMAASRRTGAWRWRRSGGRRFSDIESLRGLPKPATKHQRKNWLPAKINTSIVYEGSAFDQGFVLLGTAPLKIWGIVNPKRD
jgi:hypothetical protein